MIVKFRNGDIRTVSTIQLISMECYFKGNPADEVNYRLAKLMTIIANLLDNGNFSNQEILDIIGISNKVEL